MTRTIGVMLVMLGLAACNSGGGTPSLMQRCMDGCNRDNTLCMRTSNCAGDCTLYTSSGCSAQLTAAVDCQASVPDATYCMNAGTTCGTQFNALQACVAGDAGGGGDR